MNAFNHSLYILVLNVVSRLLIFAFWNWRWVSWMKKLLLFNNLTKDYFKKQTFDECKQKNWIFSSNIRITLRSFSIISSIQENGKCTKYSNAVFVWFLLPLETPNCIRTDIESKDELSATRKENKMHIRILSWENIWNFQRLQLIIRLINILLLENEKLSFWWIQISFGT